ncbi:hypothetical protein ON010_g1266 [Phytophthora cinnamomi]|nr:hypothetical protein ON010_g1266 [Phytophthora cinnamomi]
MTNNEFFQSPRHGFGLETRLIYKRNKELESGSTALFASMNRPDEIGFSATFESGNLDRAYRIFGRRYAPSHDLLMLRSSQSSSDSKTATKSSNEPVLASVPKAPPSQASTMPFPFFVDVDSEYDLYADTDINTLGHVQWYFFRVTVPSTLLLQIRERGATSLKVRFNIRNMLKKTSLYTDGMLPAVYIESPSPVKCGWHHSGVNVCYFKNTDTYRHRRTGKVRNYYTLSFVYEIPVQPPSSPTAAQAQSLFDDRPFVVYFAHCYPYTYTRLQRFVLSMQKDPERRNTFKRRVMCKTIAGNNCDLLTITDFSQDDEKDQSVRRRTAIVITARVHPGESNSSFVMHGILEFLTGSSLEARFLRHHFVFKIVPMLNPDGVVHGNYRCSLAGTDLNRRWLRPSTELHPTIFATKNMLLSVCKIRPKSTGRVVVWNEMQVLHSFTLEASFFGVDTTIQNSQLQTAPHGRVRLDFDITEQLSPSLRHFTPADLHMAGIKFCHALLPFSQVLMLQRANNLTLPATPKLPSTPPKSARVEQDELSGCPQQRVSDFEPPIPVKCFGPINSVNDFTSNSKIRLAPLQASLVLPKEQDGPMSWMEPQRPASPPLDPVPLGRGTENSDSFSFGFPPEFDQLFSGEDASMLSLLDHDDLIREIEAALPDNFQDNSEEDGSICSESDPSGDTTEDEDKEDQQKTPQKTVVETPSIETEHTKLAEPVLTRNRPPRVTRHLSEPRLLEAIVPKQAPSQQDAPRAGSAMIRVKPSMPIAPKSAPSLAPLRKETPAQRIVVCQNMPYDRNREIAAMHLHAVQRRSKTKRNIRQATLEVDES